jgi:hypothetical protein
MAYPNHAPIKLNIMRSKSISLLTICTLFFTFCKKDKFTNDIDLIALAYSPVEPICTATKQVPGLGSIIWTANSFAQVIDNKFGIAFITYQDTINWELRETLGFSFIPINTGKFNVGNVGDSAMGGYFRSIADGDLIDASWDLDTNKGNYIEITSLDTINRIVTGKFDTHFILTKQGVLDKHSEEINFTNGSFSVRY